jgi:hypothetical protein
MTTPPVPPSKLSYGALALLDWLCEKGPDARMVSVASTGSSLVSTLLEVDPTQPRFGLSRIHPSADAAMLERLGGRDVTDLRSLEGYGLDQFQRSSIESSIARSEPRIPAHRLAAVLERHGRDAFGYTANVHLPSARTMELWHGGARAEAEARRTARAERDASSRRLVVIRGTWRPSLDLPEEVARLLPEGFAFPLAVPRRDRPYALAEVRRETSGRLYLGKVERFPVGRGFFSGREPQVYVDKAQVMLDGATREQAFELARIHEEDAASRAHARAQLAGSIAGALSEWHSRQVQKDAELADLVAGALPPAPAPKGP